MSLSITRKVSILSVQTTHTCGNTYTESCRNTIRHTKKYSTLWDLNGNNIYTYHQASDKSTLPLFQRTPSHALMSLSVISSQCCIEGWSMSGSLACWHTLCLPPDRTLSTRLNYPLYDDSMQQSKKWCSPDSLLFRFKWIPSTNPPSPPLHSVPPFVLQTRAAAAAVGIQTVMDQGSLIYKR